jgi:hypothetical protein
MIDLNSVKCIVALAGVIIAGCVILWLLDWFWGGKAVRPLKEKSAQQKAQQKKRRKRAPQLHTDPSDEYRFRRPGGPLQPAPSMPIFGEGQPRHVRIDDTPHVIIPHETVIPTQNDDGTQGRLIRVVKIDRVDVKVPEQPLPSAPKDLKPNKFDKSNRTMPMKRIP